MPWAPPTEKWHVTKYGVLKVPWAPPTSKWSPKLFFLLEKINQKQSSRTGYSWGGGSNRVKYAALKTWRSKYKHGTHVRNHEWKQKKTRKQTSRVAIKKKYSHALTSQILTATVDDFPLYSISIYICTLFMLHRCLWPYIYININININIYLY